MTKDLRGNIARYLPQIAASFLDVLACLKTGKCAAKVKEELERLDDHQVNTTARSYFANVGCLMSSA